MLSHQVFFALVDSSAAACERLVAACHRYLKDEPGTVFFAAGTREPELAREVNDKEFDVSLHVVFADRAAHDAYQAAANHEAFIAENKDNWKAVRVFDSNVT